MNAKLKVVGSMALLLAMVIGNSGCETKAQTGALVGGAGGAAVGAGIGSLSHARAGEGALIGGAVGAIGGYIVGNEMDKADQRARAVPPAPPPPPPAGTVRPMSKEQVIASTQNGDPKEALIQQIQQRGTYRMTAADENQLRDAGVDEDVIRAMKYNSR